ncbi:hypothetical protein GLW36_05790 [Halorubrum terrestre]|uniref:Uncharacterized protein n=1 Tax=Halorubrum distributum TaxID=29283 RepID=A0A6B1IBK2_9EURY|nr:hypothetical protein [Halorubrum terrestre]MYL16161.1 hypothetical protein [Halorubrum terrestre]
MERQSQRYRSTSLPYAYRNEGLNFELDGYSVDDGEPRKLDLKAGQTRIGIPPGDEEEWETVVLSGTVHLPESTVEAVFPAEERAEPPAKLYVTVQCHQTIYRNRVSIRDAPTSVGEYDVEIRLDREDFRDEVELRPYLVRTDSNDSDGPHASDPNVRVASGQIYTAVIDPVEEDGRAQIDGEEVSFSQSTHLPEGDKLYYLDLRNEARPKLWINADHPRITDVLQSDGSVGAEPRMRDVVLDQISYSVWQQLIVRAGTAVNDDGEVEHQWQQTVIEAFAREIYDVDGVEEAALALRRDVRDPGALPELMSRIDVELQDYLDPRSQLINLIEEGLQI